MHQQSYIDIRKNVNVDVINQNFIRTDLKLSIVSTFNSPAPLRKTQNTAEQEFRWGDTRKGGGGLRGGGAGPYDEVPTSEA